MTDYKHTPAPWRYASKCGEVQAEAGESKSTTYATVAELYRPWGVDVEQMHANGHLIAAAPDMLEALEEIKEWMFTMDGMEFPDHLCAAVGRAMTKARGELEDVPPETHTRCPLLFGDEHCGYAGTAFTECGKTFADCLDRENEERFGGFLLRPDEIAQALAAKARRREQ